MFLILYNFNLTFRFTNQLRRSHDINLIRYQNKLFTNKCAQTFQSKAINFTTVKGTVISYTCIGNNRVALLLLLSQEKYQRRFVKSNK